MPTFGVGVKMIAGWKKTLLLLSLIDLSFWAPYRQLFNFQFLMTRGTSSFVPHLQMFVKRKAGKGWLGHFHGGIRRLYPHFYPRSRETCLESSTFLNDADSACVLVLNTQSAPDQISQLSGSQIQKNYFILLPSRANPIRNKTKREYSWYMTQS